MTEDEAKTKECHLRMQNLQLTLIIAKSHFDANEAQLKELSSNSYCSASDCMAWVVTDNESEPSNNSFDEPQFKAAGYCGLANVR